jgi:hypothetical protein
VNKLLKTGYGCGRHGLRVRENLEEFLGDLINAFVRALG